MINDISSVASTVYGHTSSLSSDRQPSELNLSSLQLPQSSSAPKRIGCANFIELLEGNKVNLNGPST